MAPGRVVRAVFLYFPSSKIGPSISTGSAVAIRFGSSGWGRAGLLPIAGELEQPSDDHEPPSLADFDDREAACSTRVDVLGGPTPRGAGADAEDLRRLVD